MASEQSTVQAGGAQPTDDAPGGGSWEAFHAFSTMHATVAGVCIGLVLASSVMGRRWRGGSSEQRLRRWWGLAIVLVQSLQLAYYGFVHRPFVPEENIPLQFCDVAAWIAAIAMLGQARWSRAVLYFWGIGLSTQAFFTPVLRQGPSSPEFWFFWIGHLQIVGSAIYDIVALRFRPTKRDLCIGLACTFGFGGLLVVVNMIFGTNFGYVGNAPMKARTLIDVLGPWPGRLAWMGAIVLGVFTALWAIWELPRRLGERAQPAENVPSS